MLKISGESLAGDNEQGFDFDILNDLFKILKHSQQRYQNFYCFRRRNFIQFHLFQMVLSIGNFRLYGYTGNSNEFLGPSI